MKASKAKREELLAQALRRLDQSFELPKLPPLSARRWRAKAAAARLSRYRIRILSRSRDFLLEVLQSGSFAQQHYNAVAKRRFIRAIVNPIKERLGYASIARKLLVVEPMPDADMAR